LTSPHYEKASTRSKRLPRISKEHSAVEEFRSLQSGDIIEKMQAQRSLGESVGSVHSDAANELLFLGNHGPLSEKYRLIWRRETKVYPTVVRVSVFRLLGIIDGSVVA